MGNRVDFWYIIFNSLLKSIVHSDIILQFFLGWGLLWAILIWLHSLVCMVVRILNISQYYNWMAEREKVVSDISVTFICRQVAAKLCMWHDNFLSATQKLRSVPFKKCMLLYGYSWHVLSYTCGYLWKVGKNSIALTIFSLSAIQFATVNSDFKSMKSPNNMQLTIYIDIYYIHKLWSNH